MAEKDAEASTEKGGWRGERNKVRAHLVTKKVPAGPAKVVADAAWSSVSPPADLGITLPYESPTCSLTAESAKVQFGVPFIVRYDASKTEEQLTFFENSWGNNFRDSLPSAIAKLEECKHMMKAKRSGFGNTSLSTPVPSITKEEKQVPWHSMWFEDVAEVKCAFWASHTETLNMSVECWPYSYLPGFFQLFTGNCVTIVLDEECVRTIGDVANWVTSCEAQEFAKMPVFFMAAGDTVWFPPGHVALTVGIPITIRMDKDNGVDLKGAKPNQTHFFCGGFYPVLSKSEVDSYSLELRSAVCAAWTRATPHLPGSWMKVEAVQAFTSALCPNVATIAAAEAGADEAKS